MAANPEIEKYIYDAAVKRGMNPDVALRVARAEALNVFDPTKPDLGGDDRSSFGPFQLHYAGRSAKMPNAGLGDEFTKQTGLRADDPSTWKQQVDFSLDYANRHGWKPWMGAAAAGVKAYEGLSGSATNVREDPRRDTPSTGHPVGSTLNQPPAATTAAPAVAPVSSIADVAAARELSNPWAGLASGLASSVAPSSGLSEPDMAQLPPPTTDFTSAVPAAAALTGQPGGEIGTLADLFKLGDIGQAASLRNVDRLGQPLIKRQYG